MDLSMVVLSTGVVHGPGPQSMFCLCTVKITVIKEGRNFWDFDN